MPLQLQGVEMKGNPVSCGYTIWCRHTTERPGEVCECCGQVIREHMDVCRFNRGGRCNCSAGIGKHDHVGRHPQESQ